MSAWGRLTGDPTAQRTYFDADQQLGKVWDALAEQHDAALRADLLHTAANIESERARAYPAAFGPDPNPYEGGRDTAVSLASSALLLRLLADVETVASGFQTRRVDTATVLEECIGQLLDEMTVCTLDDRMLMLESVYYWAVREVGDQAAEVLACLPAPGWRGWVREDPRDRLPSTMSVRSFLRALRVAWRTRTTGVR